MAYVTNNGKTTGRAAKGRGVNMALRTLATSVAAAIVDPNQIPFSVKQAWFKGGSKPRISIEGLVSAETVTLYVRVNGDWEELDDQAGTIVTFTATDASKVFESPGTYGYAKSATVGAIVLQVEDGT